MLQTVQESYNAVCQYVTAGANTMMATVLGAAALGCTG